MKYLKTFRMMNESLESELVDDLDDNIIEEYYNKNYEMDIDELAFICSSCVTNNFDFEKFKEDFIYDMTSSESFDNYDEYQFKEYIKEHLTEKKEQKILELYNDNNYDEDDEDDEKTTEFDINLLDDLDDDQLKEVIEVDDDEYDFIKFTVKNSYDFYSGEEIFDEFYGMSEDSIDRANKKSYSYNRPKYETFGYYLWKEYPHYVDKQGMQEDWKNGEDFDYKKEYVQQGISHSRKLQRHLLKKGKVLELAELLEEEPNGSNIGKEYKFQKSYIKKYVEENSIDDEDIKEFDEDELNEMKGELIADALEYLDNVFGELDPNIEKEYNDYMWKVMSKKYNI